MIFHRANQQVMSPEEREKKREDIIREDELRTTLKSKTEMLNELAFKGILPEDPKNQSKEEVLALCADNEISCTQQFGRELKTKKGLQEVMQNIDGVRYLQLKREYQRLAHQNKISIWNENDDIEQGWIERPKGLLHLLWKCGFINTDVPDPDKKYYTKEGKDEHGRVVLERSLEYLIRQCYDFEYEQTLLQHIGSLLGVFIDRTPKCHCEMANKGIEYSWGLGNNAYCRFPMADKKSKEKFRAMSKEST
jgi:hypothetical protein